MNRQKRIKRKRLEELKRKVKRETIKLSIVFVAGIGYGRYALNYNDNVVMPETPKETPVQETSKQVEPQNTPTFEETTQIETKQEEEYKCTLDEVSCRIKQKSIEYGVGEYANIFIAISKHETGNYTSSAFKNKKNVGGMMCKDGLITYNSLDEGIDAFVKNLANNYIKQGLNTVEKIQPKYCPIDDPRDVKGLNVHWISGVNYYLSQLEGE